MTPGDMPDFDPSLQMAMKGLNAIQDAMTKHIVVISDGDPTPPTNRRHQPARRQQDHRDHGPDRRARQRPRCDQP